MYDVPVYEGDSPITSVHVTPEVPESHCRWYDVMAEPPLAGAVVTELHVTSIYESVVEDPEVGVLIA